MSKSTPKHPIQPLVEDEHGTLRFKENAIVSHLLDYSRARGCGLNELAHMGDHFSKEDWQQLAQLIGYSLSGFSELSYVDNVTYLAAATMAETKKTAEQARIEVLEDQLTEVRKHLRKLTTAVFSIHPDDLHE